MEIVSLLLLKICIAKISGLHLDLAIATSGQQRGKTTQMHCIYEKVIQSENTDSLEGHSNRVGTEEGFLGINNIVCLDLGVGLL